MVKVFFVWKEGKAMRRIRLFFKTRRFIPFVISFFRSREIAKKKKIAYLLLFIGYFFILFDAIPDWLASVPVVVWGSTLILKWVDRFPIIITIGAGVLAWTAAKMIVGEPFLATYFANPIVKCKIWI